jgi:hypothetical protein
MITRADWPMEDGVCGEPVSARVRSSAGPIKEFFLMFEDFNEFDAV